MNFHNNSINLVTIVPLSDNKVCPSSFTYQLVEAFWIYPGTKAPTAECNSSSYTDSFVKPQVLVAANSPLPATLHTQYVDG